MSFESAGHARWRQVEKRRIWEPFARHPAVGAARRTCEEGSNHKSVGDLLGNIPDFECDAVSRAARTEDPAQRVRPCAGNLADNPKLVTGAGGSVTSFTWEAHDREVERANAVGSPWRLAPRGGATPWCRRWTPSTGRPSGPVTRLSG